MRFNTIIEHALSTTSLKKIRMKINPKEEITPNMSQPYEGYIIEESEGMVKVMMLAPGLEHEVTSINNVEPAPGNTFEKFKSFIVNYISSKNHDDCDQCEQCSYESVNLATDIQQLEMIVKEHNIESPEFQQIIKLFIMS